MGARGNTGGGETLTGNAVKQRREAHTGGELCLRGCDPDGEDAVKQRRAGHAAGELYLRGRDPDREGSQTAARGIQPGNCACGGERGRELIGGAVTGRRSDRQDQGRREGSPVERADLVSRGQADDGGQVGQQKASLWPGVPAPLGAGPGTSGSAGHIRVRRAHPGPPGTSGSAGHIRVRRAHPGPPGRPGSRGTAVGRSACAGGGRNCVAGRTGSGQGGQRRGSGAAGGQSVAVAGRVGVVVRRGLSRGIRAVGARAAGGGDGERGAGDGRFRRAR
ncbi:hypothetical protein C8E87_2112 [Paractinoplanes brasiliensis]|uniref:Uncharacterized protein n=1 Tax=Paractinoplanes brasiliensis TaxID=52695 RepID=A0A4R6JTU0_9ACTN|nr:hypothetical protein C8E87_2112 [Actinoplanes brasiliensis]